MRNAALLARGELFDWYKKRRLGKGGDWRTMLLNGIVGAFLVVVAAFIFVKIGIEFKSYTGVLEGLLALYLFVVFALNALVSAMGLRHSLFESHTSKLPLSWPISKSSIMFGKSLAAWIKALPLTYVMSYPIWITYLIIAGQPWYLYLISFFYPLLISFVEIAVGYLLCVPMQAGHILITKSVIFQILFGIVVALIIAVLYSKILDVFVKIIVNGDLNGVLEIYELSINSGWAAYLYPVTFLVNLVCYAKWVNIGFYFATLFGILLIGLLISYPSYFKIVSRSKSESSKEDWKLPKSPASALFYKEMSLLFRGKGGASEIVALFIGFPIICYAAVSATQYVFTIGNLRFIQSFFPMFIVGFTGMLVCLGAAAVSSSSMDTISREGKRLTLMKLCPVPLEKQIFIKEIVPFVMPAISYLCSMIVLLSTGLVDWSEFAWLLVIGLVYLIYIASEGTLSEIKMAARDKKSQGLMDSILPFLIPIIGFGIVILLSLAFTGYLVDENIAPWIRNGLMALLLLAFIGLAAFSFIHTIRKGPKVIEKGPKEY